VRAERRVHDRLGIEAPTGSADPDRVAVAAAAVVLALGWAIAGLVGIALGVLAALGGRLLSAHRPDPRVKARQRLVLVQLPLALELLAATLAAGVTPGEAAGHVGKAVQGPLGSLLTQVARDGDWAPIAAVGLPVTSRLAAAVARSQASGAPLEPWVSGLAADLRSQAGPRAEEAARSAGAWAVLPLGLCFLPAYLLLGVVPSLIGLAQKLR
jgi:pilus assembly protein TadC